MPTLFNVSTGKPEELEGEMLKTALASGSHAYKKGARVNVLSPDGERANLPAENISMAVQAGYKPVSQTEQAVADYVDENKGIKGALKVGLGQFVDEAALGLPELIFNHTGDAFEVAKKDALKKEHNVANIIGGVTGAGASLFTGAPLFKLASAAGERTAAHIAQKIAVTTTEKIAEAGAKRAATGLLKNMAAKGAGAAVEGAVITAPHAITEAMLGDPEAAGESLLYGVGLGAALGGGGVLAKELFGSVAGKVKNSLAAQTDLDGPQGMAKIFGNKAEGKAVEALNPTLSQMERLENSKDVKKLGRFLLDEKIVTPLASKKDMFERLERRTQEIGQEQGAFLKKIDDMTIADNRADLLIDPKEVAEKISAELKTKYAHLDAYKPALQNVENSLNELRANPAVWTIGEANKQKSAWGDVISTWGMDKTVEKKFSENIYRGINQAIEEKVAVAVGKEGLDEFKNLKMRYGYLEEAEKIAKKAAAREGKNNDLGLTSYVLGGAGAIAGGVPGAAVAMAGREVSRRYGDQILAATYDKMAGLLFAEKAMKKVAQELDTIPGILKEMAGKIPSGSRSASLNAIRRVVGDDDKVERPEARSENMEKLKEKTAQWAANPAKAAEDLETLTSPIVSGGAPIIGVAMGTKYSAAFQYLHNAMPKPPRPNSPFAPKVKWKPSDFELTKFEQKLQAIADPFSVLKDLRKGTLTRNHTEALKAVYPKLFSAIQMRVINEVANGVEPIPYQARLKLGLLMDSPMDTSMSRESLAMFQKQFLIQDQSVDNDMKANVNLSEDMQSDVQRLES